MPVPKIYWPKWAVINCNWVVINTGLTSVASFPGSSAPERDIEVVHAERAWYLFSRESPQR